MTPLPCDYDQGSKGHACVSVSVLIESSVSMARSRVAVMQFYFQFLGKSPHGILRGWTGWLSYQPQVEAALSPHLTASVFLTEAILTGVRWNLKVAIVCVSIVAKDAEHLKQSLLTSVFLLLRAGCQVHYPFIDHQFCFLDVWFDQPFTYLGY